MRREELVRNMRTAIVGCGGIAGVHAQCLEQMKNCTMVAFADIKKERADSFVARYGGRAYEDYREMLELEKPDVLHICTPHYLHVPMTVDALAAGSHVFMEKPPVISYEQLELLKEADTKAKTRLGFCFQNRYNKCIVKAKEILDSGIAGQIYGGRGIVNWTRDAGYYTDSGWRGSWSTEGGGVLINQSIHTLDLLHYFLGKPVYTEASMSNHHLKGVIEVEDTMEAYVRFEKGRGNFYATNSYCANVPPLIEIECENMRIRVEDPDITIYYKDGRIEKPDLGKLPTLGKDYWGSGHASCIHDFYECIETGKHFPQEFSDMEDLIRLLLAVYESAKMGQGVEIFR